VRRALQRAIGDAFDGTQSRRWLPSRFSAPGVTERMFSIASPTVIE
jgi:hypothetical protein